MLFVGEQTQSLVMEVTALRCKVANLHQQLSKKVRESQLASYPGLSMFVNIGRPGYKAVFNCVAFKGSTWAFFFFLTIFGIKSCTLSKFLYIARLVGQD